MLVVRVVERPWPFIVYLAMVGWFTVLCFAVRTAFLEFRYGRFDLGNMVQAVWSTAQGRPLEITMGPTGEQMLRLGGHVDPILALLAPLWIIAPTPLALAAAQIGACAVGALPVFWLGRKHLGSEAAAGLLALAYLAYPWLAWSAAEAMHPVTLAIPLLLYAIWFLDDDRLGAFAAVAILASLTGELVGVTLAALGLWYGLVRRRRAGFVIAAAGASWTVFCLVVIIPAVTGGSSMFYDLYASVGSSPQGVVRTLFTDPGAIASALFSRRDLLYVFALIAPTAGLCLLAPSLLAVAIPQLAANGLSSQLTATDPRLHLVSVPIPFVIAASVFGIVRLRSERRVAAAFIALALSVGLSAMFGPWHGTKHNGWLYGTPSSDHLAALRTGIALVPDGAAVSTTNRAGSHLSARRRVFTVPLVENAEWVVIDLQDPWVPFPRHGSEREAWGAFDRLG